MAAIQPSRQYVSAARPALRTTRQTNLTVSAPMVWTRFLLFLAFGLMVGAALGWMLFPVELDGLLPVSHNTPQTRQFIIAVADKYWHTLDAMEAQAALSAYDPVELTGIMATTLQESKSAETRAHVSALANALDLISPNAPFAELLAQPLLVLTLLASLVPLGIGIWLVILPAWRERKLEQERVALEALGLTPVGDKVARNKAANADGDAADGVGEDVLPGEQAQADDLSPDTVIGAPAAGENGAPAPLPPLQPNAAAEETEESAEERAAEEKNILKDLANLFEEEDVSLSALEALVKNLPEVAADALVTRAQEVVTKLREFFAGRPSA